MKTGATLKSAALPGGSGSQAFCQASRVVSMVRVCAMYSPYQPAILPRYAASLTTTNSQGCWLNPDGAQRAASMILSMESSGTGSGLKRRMLRVFLTISMKAS